MRNSNESKTTTVGILVFLIGLMLVNLSSAEEQRENPPVHEIVAPDTILNDIRLELMETVKNRVLPSIGVGVIYDGKVVWEEVIGWADTDNDVAATPQTLYGLASVGKSITATGVMVLVERNEVKLDDAIQPYIAPAELTVYEGDASDVTVRRLLNMTAAIPHGNLDFWSEDEAGAYTTEDIVRNRGIVVCPPGEVFLYSNFSYGVLEHLIERVSETSFSDFLTKEVFAPIGMVGARVGRSSRSPELAAVRYDENGNQMEAVYPIPQNSRSVLAGVHDLIKYASFHLRGLPPGGRQIISDSTMDIMHYERPGLRQAIMALGWGSIDLGDGLLWLLTNGRDGGAQATISLVPSKDLAVVCVTNKTGNETDEIAFRITDLLIPGFLERAGQRISDFEAWANRPYEPTPEILGEWDGAIQTGYGEVRITLSFQPNGDITVSLEGQEKALLTYVGVVEGFLCGRFSGTLSLEERGDDVHQLDLALLHKDGRLFGYVTAAFENDRGYFTLPAYVALAPKKSTGDD